MINGKKIVALCISRVNDKMCFELIKSLSESLYKKGCKLFVYCTCSDLYWRNSSEEGEASIFGLMDFEVIDAVIVFEDKLKNDDVIKDIESNAKAHNVPIINVSDDNTKDINVYFDCESAFRKLTQHLIREHGVKKIHFLAGFIDNEVSDARYEIVREVMCEEGLPVSDDMISYGDFWSLPAAKATQELIDSKNLPDAIICANDVMAIAACNTLLKNGICVPKDILVTGFDGIEEIEFSVPKLTSGKCDYVEMGEKLAELVPDVISGKLTNGHFALSAAMLWSNSCGCEPSKKINVSEYLNSLNDSFYGYQSNAHKMSEMAVRIQMSENIDDAAACVDVDLCRNFYCFLTKDCIDETINPITSIGSQHFDDEMCLFFDADEISISTPSFTPKPFLKKDIVPELDDKLNNSYPIFFLSIYLLNTALGYIAFHFRSYDVNDYVRIPQFVDSLNSAISGYRNMRHQRHLNMQIEEMYKSDALTNLYNRIGFNKAYNKLVRSLKGEERITVIIADLDGLKKINDCYGHGEGDNAIHIVSDALRSVFPHNAVRGRFGGDEMIAATKLVVDEQQVKTAFRSFFAEYNSSSEKPYVVDASIGVYTVSDSDSLEFEGLLRKADERMYQDKQSKRAQRTN